VQLTGKQEKFSLAYIETGNASEAYRQAYNADKMRQETVNRTAKDLLDNPKITARLAEIRAPAIEAAQITLEGHLKTLAELRDKAEGLGQMAAAINAEGLRGKAAGFYVQRSEITGKDGGPVELSTPKTDLSKLSDEEFEHLVELSEKARSFGSV